MPGLLAPSPFIETEIKSVGLMVIVLLSSIARPSESKPGPKFALVAGTFIINYFPHLYGWQNIQRLNIIGKMCLL